MNNLRAMRDVLIEQIYNRMGRRKDIFFLSDDFGSPILDKLRMKFKDRFINVGIAEQNLINISTGLALEGFIVYAYGIAPFITMRAYEQLRNNLSILSHIKEVNVNLIGVGAGMSYDISGPTHHCFEDITIMRLLPNFVVFSPSDWLLAGKFADYSINVKKPKYIRLDGKPIPQIYNGIKDLNLDTGFYELAKGEELCIVSTGFMTHRALKAVSEFLKNKISIGVIDVFMIKPINYDLLYNTLKKYRCIITIEEAFVNKGGLDGLVSDVVSKKNLKIRLKRIGFEDRYVFTIGSRNYLHRLNGLDEEGIIKVIKDSLEGK